MTQRQPKASAVQHEIVHFDALADQWWDEQGPMRALHRINPARLRFIRETASEHFPLKTEPHPLKGLKILDVGCGAGILCEPLARMGGQVTGVDAAPAALAAAKIHAQQQGLKINYHCGELAQILPRNATYDLVLALEVIEHVANPEDFFARLADRVAPNGLLILSTLNRTLKSLLLGKFAAEYLLGWVPRGTHDPRKFVRPEEMTRWLRALGFMPVSVAGLVYDPCRHNFRLDDRDLSINYLLAARRISDA
jgi:2-polyprenyl-6-hydroxyphenyl methylase / 3-demethylubiquinone-9 3-methyltransferase